MNIKLTNPINIDELYEKLKTQFPNYEVSYLQKKIIKVKASTSTATIINLRNDKKMKLFGDFGTTGARMLFTLSMFALGIIIPLIIFLIAFMPKQNKMRDEVANFIKKEYNLN
jgi:pilus assembly protein TadC